MARNSTDAYLKTQVMTAPPEKLKLMLYEGAIRFAGQAREKIANREFEAGHELLVRAQQIVMELICCLRPELNPSLCGRLSAVYTFIYRKLVEANVHRDASAIDDAVHILSIQRDIWLELLDKLAVEHAAAARQSQVSVGA